MSDKAGSQLARIMRPRHFLLLGASVLTTIGLAGVTGVLGSISRASFFHPPDWINWVYLTFGIGVLAVAIAGGRKVQNALPSVRQSWVARSVSQACCSAPMLRTATTSRSWPTRPITSPI
jgi:predicted MFS family arabinose efflux permease